MSPATRARVLQKAEQLGYRPNIAARSLKLNRRIRVGVYLPRHIASFFDPLRAGISAAAGATLGVGVYLVLRTFPRLDTGDVEAMRADTQEGLDGIILTPGNPERIAPMVDLFIKQGTAVVCVASDAPRTNRLASISCDAYTSGAIAAELLSRTVQRSGTVATITGELTTTDHAEKLRGFAATLAILAPHLSLLPAVESHESPREAYQQTKALFSQKPFPLGLYISTANSIPVLQALTEQSLLGSVRVITTDFFAELVPFIESGKLLATLYQRPFAQGKAAFEVLIHYLVNQVKPQEITRLSPHIILRSNLPLFLDYLRHPEEI